MLVIPKRFTLFIVKLNLFGLMILSTCFAQTELIANIADRKTTSLNGKWQYIMDPYETGFYDYRYQPRKETDREAYWNSDVPSNKSDRKEHGYSDKYTLNVPGDWNSQDEKFLYYEGTVWYKKSFDYKKTAASNRLFIYFGAVNYKSDVYLNGRKLGSHKGGFTAFNFEVPDSILRATNNFLVVKVDNKRFKDEVPTLNTDWWNYGGITREVNLVEVPKSFIADYFVQLKRSPNSVPLNSSNAEVEGWIKLNGQMQDETVLVQIPELKFKKAFPVTNGLVKLSFKLPKVKLWSPESPKLYNVIIQSKSDKTEEKIGFRTIESQGKNVMLNGKPVFMRGICIHGENPLEGRRAYTKQDASLLLGWAKELNCNMVRLAHYPHDESITRLADSLGILVWSEIPVYWTIDFTNKEVYNKAETQLTEMVSRDHNRASVIIWSVGNETPLSQARTDFMHNLIISARKADATRLISAALEVNYHEGKFLIDDPLGQFTDLVSVNEYLGWYSGLPDNCRTAQWQTKYDKPLFFSETGAEALGGFHADSLTRWSEEYQEWFYKEQIAMMKRMPDNYMGLAPWILADFRSPKRNNPTYQEGWNNKGLVDHKGNKKKAFYVLRDYYREMEKKHSK